MDARTAITQVHSNLLVVWWLLYENSVSRNTRISLNTRSRRTQIHGYLNFWQWRKGSKRGNREREKIGGRGIGERRKGGLFHFVDVSLKVRRRSDGSSAIWACPRIASKLERGWTTLSISAQVSLPSSVISVPRNPWVSFRQRSFGRVISCTPATIPYPSTTWLSRERNFPSPWNTISRRSPLFLSTRDTSSLHFRH